MMQLYLPPLPIRLLANPIHLLGIVRVVRQCLNLSLSNSANSEFSYEELVWSKRGCKEKRKGNFALRVYTLIRLLLSDYHAQATV